MEWLRTITQLVVALGIYNVWLLRFGKTTNWRGGNARSMQEEFAVYGLPDWSVNAVGFFKLLCATALILGIWYPTLTRPAALGLAVLMAGALAMHVKVKDPAQKSLPALTMLVLSLFIAAT